MVALIYNVVFPFLASLDSTYHLENTGIGVSLLNCVTC